MRARLVGALLLCGSVAASGCAAFQGVDKSEVAAGAAAEAAAPAQAPTTVAPTTAAPTTAVPAANRAPATTAATTPPPTTAAPTTAAPTTTIPLPPNVFDPACVRVIQRGESLSLIADAYDDP